MVHGHPRRSAECKCPITFVACQKNTKLEARILCTRSTDEATRGIFLVCMILYDGLHLFPKRWGAGQRKKHLNQEEQSSSPTENSKAATDGCGHQVQGVEPKRRHQIQMAILCQNPHESNPSLTLKHSKRDLRETPGVKRSNQLLTKKIQKSAGGLAIVPLYRDMSMVSFSKKLGPPRPKFHAMPLSSRTPKFGIEGMSYCLSCMRDSFRSGPLEMVNFLPRECVLHICMRTTWLFLPFQNIARRAPVRRFPVHTHPTDWINMCPAVAWLLHADLR